MNEIEQLRKALEANRELVKLLNQRDELITQLTEENAARQIACMLMLRALYQSCQNQPQTAQYLERLTAFVQAQPGYVLGNMDNFHRMKAHLDWMTSPSQPV
ncbi:MAG: hypothetical protein Q4F13_02660 [Pseudomonadota bacterium]|nr:hypothetical protein [Pseudomonadota bacterium]